MFVSALELQQGRVPYKEVLIPYGYLTTKVQALSLSVLGASLASPGIGTGLFYSLSLFLSYRLFLHILSRQLALLSVLFIFLVHPYIVHPWPNYLSYTFQLLALLLFIEGRTTTASRTAAGLCIGLATMCRYTSAIATLPPFFIYFLLQLRGEGPSKSNLKGMALFTLGFLAPILGFVIYLGAHGALYDLYVQNRVIADAWSRGITLRNALPSLVEHILLFKTWPQRDTRSLCFLLVFLVCLGTSLRLASRIFEKHPECSKRESHLTLFCLTALFGYLNSLHLYQIFRLVNGSSIGIGVTVFVISHWAKRIAIPRRALSTLAAVVVIIWTKSLLFQATSSVYLPWRIESVRGEGIVSCPLSIFEGKRVSKEYCGFYTHLAKLLSRYDGSFALVNYTWDPLLGALTDIPKVQISPFFLGPPFHLPFEKYKYRQEEALIERFISAHRAIIFTTKEMQRPGYRVIFSEPWPEDAPFFPQSRRLFLLAPVGPEADAEEPRQVPAQEPPELRPRTSRESRAIAPPRIRPLRDAVLPT